MGFLSTAAYLEEPATSYLKLAYPVQKRVKKVLAAITDTTLDEVAVGVDGFGAPVFGMPFHGLALVMVRYGAGRGLSQSREHAAA